MYFQDKIVWITGASSGIGEAFAYQLNEQGAKLILSARRNEALQTVRQNCKNKDKEIMLMPLDLADHDAIPRKAQEVINHFGGIDILINNGGISQRSFAKDTVLDVDKRIMNVNYFGTIALTKAVLPTMLKQKLGHIVVMSSVTGKIGVPARSAYAASKHALFGFFDTLRAECWNDNLKVTIFCPGYIHTNISINALTKDGSPQKTMDNHTEKGMSPNEFCKKALKAISKQREEVYAGGTEIIGIYLRRYFPRLFSRIIRKRKEAK